MNIGIIGGDSRTVQLIKFLEKDKKQIVLYGLENCEQLKNFNHEKSLEGVLSKSDTIITSIPLSKDGKFVNAVFSDKKIEVRDIFEKSKNKKIVTGNITNEIQSYIKIINEELIQSSECLKNENNSINDKKYKAIKDINQNEIIDILKQEELTVLNSIPTAEGAIQIAMEKSLKTIHNSKCLVLGFGRIGKILSKMLLGIGAQVYCEARKQSDIAWIQAYGYNAICLEKLNENLDKFDFIFNTIPYLILDKNNLKLIKKDCLLIDLASKPGGIDFDEADRLQLQTVWALALPGKVAPETAAKYIYEIVKEL